MIETTRSVSLHDASPAEVRLAAREGRLRQHTSGLAAGYAQANLVILPRDWAYDFLLFCQRNPKPCPLLDVTEVGSPEPPLVAPGADLRTDLPRYRVYRDGELVDEPDDVVDLWSPDHVAFLLGCSYTFEWPMLEAGLPLRHLEAGRNVAMYRTNQPCVPAGRLAGPLVVSMRPLPSNEVSRAVQVTSRFPSVHGSPVQIGDPVRLGIDDLNRPNWGDPPVIHSEDIPVFWACGVTPQAVAMAARPPLLISHAPGHMFVTDIKVSSIALF